MKLLFSLNFRATLEMSIRHSLLEKKNEYEAFMRAQKEKEKEFKNFKKDEIQLRAAEDSMNNLKLAHEKVLAKVKITIFKIK